MFQFVYPAKIKKDTGGFFLVTFPDIPFAATDAKTLSDALKEARDCLEEAVAGIIADSLDFPFPSPVRKGCHAIPLTAQMSAKASPARTSRDIQRKTVLFPMVGAVKLF
ncbi:MAG: type II toxin-antitoxin system HicB family antitoxin [Deltaproteobacteria bacterium]|nr:type II toxin-antitoxin system HicB family antitoxin [Deltaproteobacteria bacterium]MBW1960403.1 type II toxin-antitoxin system HicB family antitoxin [Deltaproteobacteria bacterium]MBW2153431.1 type II toxin-antitoxin system HicB family antitoxin [Deltaproteobacteria bacterium]